MNTPISFELAKLLQDKKINIYSKYRYTDFNGTERLEEDASEIFPYAPTISEVVMWLYEKWGIWIEVYMDDDTTFGYLISEVTNEGRVDSPLQRGFTSPTDAYERGIEYTLKNLI